MNKKRRHPIDGQMAAITGGLFRRLRLGPLEKHHDTTLVLGAFALVNGFISIGIMAGVALATGQPFIFPSLGPTAFLLFYTPLLASASPRNTVTGHLIGVIAGYLALVIFGLTAAGPALQEGVTPPRVLAAALSLGVTSGVMVWLHVPHPPAGATTLIVSLGIMTRPVELVVLMLAVVLIVGQALVINRFAGVDYPLWSPHIRPEGQPPGASSVS